MSGFPWGGSEYLWSMTAIEALHDRHSVSFSMPDWAEQSHPTVNQLVQQGAQFFPRSRQPQSLVDRALNKVRQIRPIKVLEACFPESLDAVRSTYRPIFANQPDIICVSQGTSYEAAAIPELAELLLTTTIPYVLVCHFNSDVWLLDEQWRSTARKLFEKATAIAFVSEHNLKSAERHLAYRLNDAVVLQNPVNLSHDEIVPWVETTPISFATVARLETFFKGQDVLFEALSAPEWRSRLWQCQLYGAGPDRAYLESLADCYGIRDRICFKGHVADVRSIWADNQMLVLPSKGEGTPLALIEAMICGRPAIVTNVGGNAEWIEEGKTGFVAEAPTAIALKAALERAWQHQQHWQTMGMKAHQIALQRRDRTPAQSLLNFILEAMPHRFALSDSQFTLSKP
ncbi:glycosyl transferase group 1 [Leptolyngbya sp. NIES-3755]|nr:glycosyl transferase group 1 [Leptolyngbya sp. NIES-3755]